MKISNTFFLTYHSSIAAPTAATDLVLLALTHGESSPAPPIFAGNNHYEINIMFSPKIQLRSRAVRHHLCKHSKFAPLFSQSTVSDEQRQQQSQLEQLEESVTNRSYWTKRIHKLCAIDHNVEEAIRLVNNLSNHGYRLDTLNLSSIIHALCDSNRFGEAHSCFQSCLSGSSAIGIIVPDEQTCNVIIVRLLDWGKRPYVTLRVVHRILPMKPPLVPSLTNFNRLNGFPVFQRSCEVKVEDAHIAIFDIAKVLVVILLEQLITKLQETKEWLYEDGKDETKGVYVVKLDELKK
ncbi:pentatricopeptide repeat-containing protein, partial [Tanacetum coccineum]